MPHWRKRFNRLAYRWKFLAAPNGRTMGANFCVCQGFYSGDNNAYLLDGYTPLFYPLDRMVTIERTEQRRVTGAYVHLSFHLFLKGKAMASTGHASLHSRHLVQLLIEGDCGAP
jgi:hypothetical protein